MWGTPFSSSNRVKSILIKEGDTLITYASATTLTKGGERILHINQQEYSKADFKLNINSVKSSVFEPDVDENSVKEIMAKDTVVLSGTYADDTTFNFTIPVIK